MQHRRPNPLLLACFVVLITPQLAMLWTNKDKVWSGYPDFAIFYAGAKIVHDGLGKTLYDFNLQKDYTRQFSARPLPLSFNHPPFELLIFLPISFFSYPKAYVLWALTNGVFLFIVAQLLRPYCENLRRSLPLILLLLLFFPIFVAALEGQDSILLLLLYTVAFACLKQNRELTAGSVLALGLFKFQLVLPFLVEPLMNRRWKIFAGFLATAATLAVVSWHLVGWSGAAMYANLLREQNQDLASQRTQDQWYIYPARMPNLRGFVQTLFLGKIPESYLNVGILFCSAVLIVWAGRRWGGNSKSEDTTTDLRFSLNVVATVLVSYHLYLHDASLLILPLLLVGNHLLSKNGPQGLARSGLSLAIFPFFLPPLYLVLWWHKQFYLLFVLVLAFALLISAETSRSEKEQESGAP